MAFVAYIVTASLLKSYYLYIQIYIAPCYIFLTTRDVINNADLTLSHRYPTRYTVATCVRMSIVRVLRDPISCCPYKYSIKVFIDTGVSDLENMYIVYWRFLDVG